MILAQWVLAWNTIGFLYRTYTANGGGGGGDGRDILHHNETTATTNRHMTFFSLFNIIPSQTTSSSFNVLHYVYTMRTKRIYQFNKQTSSSISVWHGQHTAANAMFKHLDIAQCPLSLRAFDVHTNLIWITQTSLRVHELVRLVYHTASICNRKSVACWCWKVQCVCTVYRSQYMNERVPLYGISAKRCRKRANRKSQTFQGHSCARNNDIHNWLDNSAYAHRNMYMWE